MKNISNKYVSDKILDTHDVTEAYVGKIGIIPLKIKEDLHEAFFSYDEGLNEQLSLYINDLYTLANNSPHVMEISPTQEEYQEQLKNSQFGVSFWPSESMISVNYINFRLVMPARTRDLLGVFKESWSPEEFNITFNGKLFLTYAPIDELPTFTDLGQIAREYLKDLMGESKIVIPSDSVGPTPLHPIIYVIKIKPKENTTNDEIEIQTVNYVDDDIVIIIPDHVKIDEIINPISQEMDLYISSFYSQRIMDKNLSKLIDKIELYNKELSTKLSAHYKSPLINRFFSKTPKEIRELLASMHLCLQQISSIQFEINKERESAIKNIEESTLFNGISNYFIDHMKDENNFDRESQLTSMNFAADETSNFVITQASLIAALTGALIGGLITSISQYLSGGGG